MDELVEMLLERLNDVRPRPGVSLNPTDVIEIRNFCRLLDNWWHTMEPMLATAGANARRRETVPAIHTYRHNIAFWLSGTRDILEENDPEGEWLLLDHIRNTINLKQRN
ncbi:Uncharacterised protein [uncultured archaeon]|nr:Uncharacterised protein [uncultured archaeon]